MTQLYIALVNIETELSEVSVSVLVDSLGQLGLLYKTLHGVSHKGVREHVRDDVEVLRSDIRCSSEIIVS